MDIFGPFAPNVKVQMDDLILGGHSFGGITAITTAAKLPENSQPKAVMTLDPWFFPNHEEFLSQKLKISCPIHCINSEKWLDEIPRRYYN